jgi:hypothetical protein
LASGFNQVDAFSFAVHYAHDVGDLVAPPPPSQPEGLLFSPPPSLDEPRGGMSIPIALFAAFPAAVAQTLAGGRWATVGLILALVFGLVIMWDSIKENWLWVAAVPFVGGLIAWLLSVVVIQFLLWLVLVALQFGVIVGGLTAYAPHLSEMFGDLLDKFHLTKSVVSDASRVFGRGKIAEGLERLERRPPS